MSERSPHLQEEARLTRRDIIKASLGLGSAALTVGCGTVAYNPAMEIIKKIRAVGHDYSNYPFLEAVNARYLNQSRLDELLSGSEDDIVKAERIEKDLQVNSEHLAEFTFVLDEPGPVHVQFDGLRGDDVSLTVLKISIDDNGKEFYLPIVQGPNKELPTQIQLGEHGHGEHRFDISIAHGSGPVTPEEILPSISREQPGSIRNFIDIHQPNIYLRDYGNIAHNIPLRSAVFVYETDTALALVYWTKCLGEDLEYGLFGTTVEELLETKGRPIDWDWTLEACIDKQDGALEMANIAEPFHNRREYTIPSLYTAHPPLREVSSNNNVRPVVNERTLTLPSFLPRPAIYVHEDRKDVLYGVGRDTALLSMREQFNRGNVDIDSPQIINYLGALGLDVASLRSNHS